MVLKREGFITYADALQTQEARRHNLVEIVVWDVKTGKPTIIKQPVKYAVPTGSIPADDHYRMKPKLDQAVERFKQALHARVETDLAKQEERLSQCIEEEAKRKRKEKTRKRFNLEHQVRNLEEFLAGLEDRIQLRLIRQGEDGYVYHLEMPFVDINFQQRHLPSQWQKGFSGFGFQVDSPYNSFQRQINYRLGMPFALCGYDHQCEVRGQRASLDLLLRGGLVIDHETHNWRTLRIDQELRDASEEELRQRYIDLAAAFNHPIKQEESEWWSRKDLIGQIEEILNKHRDERITTTSLVSEDRFEVPTTFDTGADSILVNVPGEDRKVLVRIIELENQQEIVAHINDVVDETDPLGIFGHYHMKFDLKKAHEFTGNLQLGVDGSPPKFVSGAGLSPTGGDGYFIEQRGVKGRVVIDPALYSQNYMTNINNKLDTVFAELFGIYDRKSMTHSELFVKTTRAEGGSKRDALDIISYAVQDSIKSDKMCRRLMPEHILLAKLFRSMPSRIDAVAKKTLSEDYWVFRHYRNYRNYPDVDFDRLEMKLDDRLRGLYRFRNKQALAWDDFCLHDLTKKLCNYRATKPFRSKRGLYDGVAVALFPFVHNLFHFIEDDPEAVALYEHIRSIDDKKEKIRLLQALHAIIEYPVYRVLEGSPTRLTAYAEADADPFLERQFIHEFSQGTIDVYNDMICDDIRQLVQILQTNEVINHSKFYVVFEDAPNLESALQEIEQSKLGVVLGKGRVLSGTAGRFAFYQAPILYTPGLMDPDSRKGERCMFENMTIKEFIRLALIEDDPRAALQYLSQRARMFAEGQLTEEELVYEREIRRDFDTYAAAARVPWKTRVMEGQIRQGEVLSYRHTDEELRRKFFGFPTREDNENMRKHEVNQRQQEAYAAYLEDSEEFKRGDLLFEPEEVTKPEPVKKPNIPEGTIRDIVRWRFPVAKADTANAALDHIFLGRGTEGDIDEVLENQKSF